MQWFYRLLLLCPLSFITPNVFPSNKLINLTIRNLKQCCVMYADTSQAEAAVTRYCPKSKTSPWKAAKRRAGWTGRGKWGLLVCLIQTLWGQAIWWHPALSISALLWLWEKGRGNVTQIYCVWSLLKTGRLSTAWRCCSSKAPGGATGNQTTGAQQSKKWIYCRYQEKPNCSE